MAQINPEEYKKQVEELNDELLALNDALVSIGNKIKSNIGSQIDNLNESTKKVAETFQRDLTNAINRSKKGLDGYGNIQNKILKGQDASKDIEKEISKVQKERQASLRQLELLRRNGVEVAHEDVTALEEALATQQSQLETLNDINTSQIANRGITGNLAKTAKEYLISLDKSGLAAKLLEGELDGAQKTALLAEASLLAIAKGALAGSDNIANLQKNLGISYGNAYQLQNNLALSAANSEKLFINSKDLNKSLTDLVETTGLLSTFSGDTLVTMTTLTKQLGFGAKEASQLSLLARTQSEDTNSVLENTVDTVNAINRQNKSAISAKAVLNDIATASASIVVSLGMSPELLAEAATEARALGLNLEKVDAIAASLLQFESSIENELKAELLLGKEINLEKARLAALNNDSAALSKEIAENTALTETFATGNRIQQEAAAAALGMSRNDLADMVMQQQYLNLAQDDFIAQYGEQSYQAMQAQSASEKFQASLEKIQGIIGDIGTVLSPIIDGFASVVGFLAQSKVAAVALVGVLAGLATLSIIKAIADITSSSFFAGPLAGPALAAAGIIGLMSAIGAGTAMVAQSVQDGIAPSSKGPFTITDSYGAMAVTAKGDSIMASPNITNSATSAGNSEQSRTNALLERLLAKDSNVYMDSDKVGSSFAKSASF